MGRIASWASFLLIPVLVASQAASASGLSGPPLGAPRQATDYEEHEPIRIGGDDDLQKAGLLPIFAQPNDEKGIRSGNGTKEDPFIIEKWRIKARGIAEPAIKIALTTKFIVIRDVILEDADQKYCCGGTGVVLVRVQNVRIEGAQITALKTGVFVQNSSNVHLSDSDLWGPQWANNLLDVRYSRDVQVSGVTFRGPTTGIGWYSSSGSITDSTLTGGPSPPGTDDPEAPYKSYGAIQVAEAKAPSMGEQDGGPSRMAVSGVEILEYVYEEYGYKEEFALNGAVIVRDNSTVSVAGSQFRGNYRGLTVEAGRLTVSDSALLDNGIGLLVNGRCEECTIRNSELVGNQVHIRNDGTLEIDARENWWGSPDGPDEGLLQGPVDVRPWLREGEHEAQRRAPGVPLWLLLAAILGRFGLYRREV